MDFQIFTQGDHANSKLIHEALLLGSRFNWRAPVD